ncbi:MAG: hypothetical protein AB1640_13960 [bacterium]
MGYGERAENTARVMRPSIDQRILPLVRQWKKTTQFYHFLRRELAQARTEAEREVIRTEIGRVRTKLLGLKVLAKSLVDRPAAERTSRSAGPTLLELPLQ